MLSAGRAPRAVPRIGCRNRVARSPSSAVSSVTERFPGRFGFPFLSPPLPPLSFFLLFVFFLYRCPRFLGVFLAFVPLFVSVARIARKQPKPSRGVLSPTGLQFNRPRIRFSLSGTKPTCARFADRLGRPEIDKIFGQTTRVAVCVERGRQTDSYAACTLVGRGHAPAIGIA